MSEIAKRNFLLKKPWVKYVKNEGRARARKGERKKTGYTSIISTTWNQNAGSLIWFFLKTTQRHLCSYASLIVVILLFFVFFSRATLYLRFFQILSAVHIAMSIINPIQLYSDQFVRPRSNSIERNEYDDSILGPKLLGQIIHSTN